MNEMLTNQEAGHVIPFSKKMVDEPRRSVETAQLKNLFERLDVDPETINPRLLETLKYLSEHSETMEDEWRAREMASTIAEYCDRAESANRLSPEQWRYVNLASTLTDVGKIGPVSEEINQTNRLVTKLYAETGGCAPTTPLSQFIDTFFSREAEAMKEAVRQTPELELDMPMRDFWDLHPQWTLDQLKDSGIPREVALTAAAHHMLQNDAANPRVDGVPIIDQSSGRLRGFGMDRPIDQREIWVVLFDKYEANRTRSGSSHEGAISWLKKIFEGNKTLSALPELQEKFLSCIEDLDAARPSDSLFARPEEEAVAAK